VGMQWSLNHIIQDKNIQAAHVRSKNRRNPVPVSLSESFAQHFLKGYETIHSTL
jgi:hypothetical protein